MIDEKKLIEFIKSNDFKRRIIQSKDSIQDILVQFIIEQPKVGEWIPCSGCIDCKHKECENYGKV